MARYIDERNTQSSVQGFNSETEKVAQTQQDHLSRVEVDGPNQMETTLDMNSERIINLPNPESDQEPLTLGVGKQMLAEGEVQADRAKEEADRAEAEADRAEDAANFSEAYTDYLQEFVETASFSTETPEGTVQRTLSGINSDAQDVIDSIEDSVSSAIQNSGWIRAGTFGTEFTLETRNQVAFDSDSDTSWAWNGSLPHTVLAEDEPSAPDWLDVTDGMLRSNLAEEDSTVLVGGVAASSLMGTLPTESLFTVGVTGDFDTLNNALEYLSRFRMRYLVTAEPVEVRLLSGFVMQEQVIVISNDLSFITITAEDAEVEVERGAISAPIPGGSRSVSGDVVPTFSPAVFAATLNGKLPTIGALFSYNTSGTDHGSHGVYIAYGSYARILPGCGVTNAPGIGLGSIHGSRIVAPESIFDNAGSHGVATFRNSQCDFRYGSATNAGDSGCYTGSASTTEALQADFSNANDWGIECYGGSTVHCREVDVSGAGQDGLFSRDGSIIASRNPIIDNVGNRGISCVNGGRVYAEGASILDAGSTGIYADAGAIVSADDSTITGAGSRAIFCQGSQVTVDNSTISAVGTMEPIFVSRGGNLAMGDCTVTSPSGVDNIFIARGGIVAAGGTTATANVAFNEVTASGIIFN